MSKLTADYADAKPMNYTLGRNQNSFRLQEKLICQHSCLSLALGPQMRDLTIRDLIDLVLSETADPAERIQKMFEWHFDRAKTIVTWWLGAASSIVIALIATYFSEKSRLSGW